MTTFDPYAWEDERDKLEEEIAALKFRVKQLEAEQELKLERLIVQPNQQLIVRLPPNVSLTPELKERLRQAFIKASRHEGPVLVLEHGLELEATQNG